MGYGSSTFGIQKENALDYTFFFVDFFSIFKQSKSLILPIDWLGFRTISIHFSMNLEAELLCF